MKTVTHLEPNDEDATKRPVVEAWSAEGYHEYCTLLAVLPDHPRFLVWVDGFVKRHVHCKMRLDQRQ
jgi:hypothetical protein